MATTTASSNFEVPCINLKTLSLDQIMDSRA